MCVRVCVCMCVCVLCDVCCLLYMYVFALVCIVCCTCCMYIVCYACVLFVLCVLFVQSACFLCVFAWCALRAWWVSGVARELASLQENKKTLRMRVMNLIYINKLLTLRDTADTWGWMSPVVVASGAAVTTMLIFCFLFLLVLSRLVQQGFRSGTDGRGGMF